LEEHKEYEKKYKEKEKEKGTRRSVRTGTINDRRRTMKISDVWNGTRS
jgi:hypothetical protein